MLPPMSPQGKDIQTPLRPKMRGSVRSGTNIQKTWRQKESASEAAPLPSPWSAEFVIIVIPMKGMPEISKSLWALPLTVR